MNKIVLLNDDYFKGKIEEEKENTIKLRINQKEAIIINKKFVKEVLNE